MLAIAPVVTVIALVALVLTPAQALAAPLAVPPVPFVPEAPQEATESDAEEATYSHLLQYRRQQLSVRPVVKALWSTPIPVPTDLRRPLRHEAWAPVPGDSVDWGIVRGSAEVLDDLDLADLLDDRALRASIEQERLWPRVAWTTAFSAVGAGAVGTGIWLTWFNGLPEPLPGQPDLRRDPVAIGTSLLVAGVTSIALGVLYPAMSPPRHVLSPLDAQAACDRYNEQLRRGLDLSPHEIQQ